MGGRYTYIDQEDWDRWCKVDLQIKDRPVLYEDPNSEPAARLMEAHEKYKFTGQVLLDYLYELDLLVDKFKTRQFEEDREYQKYLELKQKFER